MHEEASIKHGEDEGFENPMPEEFLLPRKRFEDQNRVEEAITRSEEVMGGPFGNYINKTPTVLNAIRLRMFNLFLLKEKVSKKDITRVQRKMASLARKERKAASKVSPLPTIGIELEVPGVSVIPKMEEVFKRLGIESGADTTDIYEFRDSASFSAHTQARVLSEIGKWGFSELPKYGVELPLHLNFGIPDDVHREISTNNIFRLQIQTLINAVTAGFVSPNRILHKNWGIPDDLHLLRDEELTPEKKITARAEIRTPSFEESSDFRMLIEIQAIVSALIANFREVMSTYGRGMDTRLAEEWRDFEEQIKNLFKFKIPDHSLSNGQLGVQTFAEYKSVDPHFERDARNIISRSAKKILRIID